VIKLCNAECVPSAQLELHGTFPMPGDLRPNPNWARLPLFDRKDWTRVRFGNVVQNVNETERRPAEAGIERFIGLEHLEPGSLHVRAWGDVADGTTFTRRCRPGQILVDGDPEKKGREIEIMLSRLATYQPGRTLGSEGTAQGTLEI